MKIIKGIFFLASVLVVIFGFSSCTDMANLKFTNDTNTTQNFVIRIDGEWETNNNDEIEDRSLSPSRTLTIGRSPGFSYEVYRSSEDTSAYIWSGNVAEGETVELRFSEAVR